MQPQQAMNHTPNISAMAASTRVTQSMRLPIVEYSYSASGKPVFFSDNWIVDTWATNHITCHLKNLINIKEISNWTVLLPNGLKLKATHMGDIVFSSDFVLNDVLYVPSFSYNLLSVTAV